MDWKYHHLRLTAFLKEAVNTREISWWNDTVGSDSESTNITGNLVRVEEAVKNDLILSLKVEPHRVDWILKSLDTQNLEDFPNLGDKAKALSTLKEISVNWFKISKISDVGRLAFGVRLFKNVEDRLEGYNDLNKMLPFVEIHPESSSDFLYQINRSLDSTTVQGLKINRLAKWHVVNMKTVALNITSDLKAALTSDLYATALDLDINSDADRDSPLPNNNLEKLFEEFISLGEEIAIKGDFK